MIGLKINLSKNSIIGVGRDLMTATQIAFDLGCKVDNFLLIYIGVPLRDRVLNCSGYDSFVDMLRTRLSQWKSRHLFWEVDLLF